MMPNPDEPALGGEAGGCPCDDAKHIAAVIELVEAASALGLRNLVAGWNGENRPEGPFEPHPNRLGVTLRTNAGKVYRLDRAILAVRELLKERDDG